jgi:glycosyltransferase involved in cell wall biosynthesis
VVEYGADTNRFSPTEPRADRNSGVRLLFVGSLVLRKGLPYLLEAVKRVQGLGVKITLVGLLRVRPEAVAPYAGFSEVRGSLLHAEMPELYRSHDIYVFPSLVEGSSLSIYEALASGLPVITTPNSGSIVRDGLEGIIVPPRDVERLADAIERLVQDPELRLRMGQAARRRALDHGDWTHYGARLARAVLERFPGMTRAGRSTPRPAGAITGAQG